MEGGREGGKGGGDLARGRGPENGARCSSEWVRRSGGRVGEWALGVTGWDKESVGASGQVVPCAGPSERNEHPYSIIIVSTSQAFKLRSDSDVIVLSSNNDWRHD